MKYVSNIFLAVALGVFVCFIYTLFVSKSRRPSRRELLSGSFTKVDVQNPNAQFMYQDKNTVHKVPAAPVDTAAVTAVVDTAVADIVAADIIFKRPIAF